MSKTELVEALQLDCDGEATLDELIRAYTKKHYPVEIYGDNYVQLDEIKSNFSKYAKPLMKEGIIKREVRKMEDIRKRKVSYYILLKQRVNEDITKMIYNWMSDLL